MHRLFLEVEAGEVDPASLEPSLVAKLDEYREQLREACRDTVGERIEVMLRQGEAEQWLPCGLVELRGPEASPDRLAP
jgi:hypothetical protein